MAVSYLRQTAARISTEFGVRVETRLGVGHPSREIGQLAQAAQADLIVLGNSKGNFLADLLRINLALRPAK